VDSGDAVRILCQASRIGRVDGARGESAVESGTYSGEFEGRGTRYARGAPVSVRNTMVDPISLVTRSKDGRSEWL